MLLLLTGLKSSIVEWSADYLHQRVVMEQVLWYKLQAFKKSFS